ncbi:hypothetical protein IAT38_001087 [Cryptococcus sp. DSM 104549]
MASLPDAIAQSATSLYASLPTHGKPRIRDNGVPEWTILATISLVLPPVSSSRPSTPDNGGTQRMTRVMPISLGTGVKVLPHARLPPLGDAVHDCHAEILARRGFVRWLISQARLAARLERTKGKEKEVAGEAEGEVHVERGEDGRFKLKDGLGVWLYVSQLPCGDASTMYTAAHQPADQASQWVDTPPPLPTPSGSLTPATRNSSSSPAPQEPTGPLRGRGTYAHLSSLRTKPGRPDSPPTTSLSCSDKIATWCVLGLQGGLLAELFGKVPLEGIVLGGVEVPLSWEGREGEWGKKVREEAERALCGRLEGIPAYPTPPYTLNRPSIHLTQHIFPHSKSAIAASLPASSPLDPTSTPLCLSFLPFLPCPPPKPGKPPGPAKMEIISNGCLLSFVWKPPGRVLLKTKGRSAVCKFEVLLALEQLERELHTGGTGGGEDPEGEERVTYFAKKHANPAYQDAKALIRGVARRTKGSGPWSKLGEMLITDRVPGSEERYPAPPFRGWFVSGEEFEGFTTAETEPDGTIEAHEVQARAQARQRALRLGLPYGSSSDDLTDYWRVGFKKYHTDGSIYTTSSSSEEDSDREAEGGKVEVERAGAEGADTVKVGPNLEDGGGGDDLDGDADDEADQGSDGDEIEGGEDDRDGEEDADGIVEQQRVPRGEDGEAASASEDTSTQNEIFPAHCLMTISSDTEECMRTAWVYLTHSQKKFIKRRYDQAQEKRKSQGKTDNHWRERQRKKKLKKEEGRRRRGRGTTRGAIDGRWSIDEYREFETCAALDTPISATHPKSSIRS